MIRTLVIFTALVTAALHLLVFTPVDEELSQASHHLVFLTLCDGLEGVVITTDPPIYVSDAFPPSDETLKLMQDAHAAGRVVGVTLIRPGCPIPDQRT